MAVKRDVIALAMNSVTSQAQLCVKASVSVPNQHTSTKIKLPNELESTALLTVCASPTGSAASTPIGTLATAVPACCELLEFALLVAASADNAPQR